MFVQLCGLLCINCTVVHLFLLLIGCYNDRLTGSFSHNLRQLYNMASGFHCKFLDGSSREEDSLSQSGRISLGRLSQSDCFEAVMKKVLTAT
jgi:hypothetical protein